MTRITSLASLLFLCLFVIYTPAAVSEGGYPPPPPSSSYIPAAESVSVQEIGDFLTVEGVSLYDHEETVQALLGKPDVIEDDPVLPGCTTYQYGGLIVNFYEGIVEYVEVLATVPDLRINETTIKMNLEDLEQQLGEPSYVAEDGLVYTGRQGSGVIKLMKDAQTGELTSVSFFTNMEI
ncbi:hypothetical protein ACFO9Q_22455 [Paenibacillus sp. GCM10023252]|uniref:hypothetical protein n=1 Tax=Paenibacillus sp. GCM10023252 TaxID=3252649 RepID=UPI00360D2540